jgi:hypothetical protein
LKLVEKIKEKEFRSFFVFDTHARATGEGWNLIMVKNETPSKRTILIPKQATSRRHCFLEFFLNKKETIQF